MHLFYTPDIKENFYTLHEEESKHCVQVLRLKEGDIIQLVDGRGTWYEAEIEEAHPKKCRLKILFQKEEYGKRDFHIHIAIAPTKNIERLEWFLEKATEIGIDTITPIICTRSERREVKIERLKKVITSAMKQSLRAYHPQLQAPVLWKDFFKQSFTGKKMIAHCMEGTKQEIRHCVHPEDTGALLLIGPEGDFTTEEINLAIENGFIPVTLGAIRLRTETAALSAVFELNFIQRETHA